jgi:hypothetical protein
LAQTKPKKKLAMKTGATAATTMYMFEIRERGSGPISAPFGKETSSHKNPPLRLRRLLPIFVILTSQYY